MARAPKLNDDEKAELVGKWVKGKTKAELSREYDVSAPIVAKYIHESDAKQPTKRKKREAPVAEKKTPATSVSDFISRVRSVIYRSSHKDYKRWERLVEEFETDGGMSKQEACVQAAKDFPVCKGLFKMYSASVTGHDPHPESHPGIYTGQQEGMECENREMSHRENLDWAIEAAGKEKNEGESPMSCPNYTAYYLYRQARDDPKDFLSKFTQIVGRGSDELDEQRHARKSGERSISEINEMLETLTPGEE